MDYRQLPHPWFWINPLHVMLFVLQFGEEVYGLYGKSAVVEVVTVKTFEAPLTRKSRSILESRQIVSLKQISFRMVRFCLVSTVSLVVTCRVILEARTTWPTSTTLNTLWSSTLCCGWWSLSPSPSPSSPTTCGTWTRATTASSTAWPIRRSGWTRSWPSCPPSSSS